MQLSRLKRLLKLIGVLQAGKGLNVNALAESCGVSRRTTFRDLQTLKQAGVPLEFDEQQQCYRIPGTYFLPPTHFTAQEALAVIVLCQELGQKHQFPYFAHAQSAALKLESSLPVPLRDYLRLVSGALRIRLPALMQSADLGKFDPYQTLVDAIASKQALRIRYDSVFEGEVIQTRLSPYQLLFSRHTWYVIGRSSIHRAVRTFHLGRILEIETLGDTFKVPRNFTIERYLRGAWNLIPEPGPKQQIVVRFSRLVAKNVAAVSWHPSQQLKFLDDGRLEFYAHVRGLQEISWWIMSYGDQAQVIAPPRLKELIVKRAEALLAQYR